MSLIDRRFQLADAPASLGLHCTPDGVTLAGIPLLRTTVTGLAPRPTGDLSALLKAAYGRDLDLESLARGLTVVAKALDDSDVGRAMVAAVRLRLPDLDVAATQRLSNANAMLQKAYNEQEPRDWHGRWTTGGVGTARRSKPRRSRPPSRTEHISAPPARQAAVAAPARRVVLQTAAAGVPPGPAVWEAFRTLYPNFQSQFDDLGPVEFSKRVTRFGEWIEAQAHANRPFDRVGAKAEYYFLQNRLEFWLGYPDKSPRSQLNLISSAQSLFQGAILSGLVREGDPDSFPRSWAAVVGMAMVLDGSANGRGGVAIPKLPQMPEFAPTMAQRAGVITAEVENADVGIGWGKGIQDQGVPWEVHSHSNAPADAVYFPRAMTWDIGVLGEGKVISAKTLDSTTYTYSAYPKKIFSKLKIYVDAAAKYDLATTRPAARVPLKVIESREIQLAVPSETSTKQWDYIIRAQRYSESRGVAFKVTVVR